MRIPEYQSKGAPTPQARSTGAMGAAIRNIGQDITNFGDRMQAAQARYDDQVSTTQAMDAFVKHREYLDGVKKTELDGVSGEGSVGLANSATDFADRSIKGIGDNLSPAARAKFNSKAKGHRIQWSSHFAGEEFKRTKAWKDETFKNFSIQTIQQSAGFSNEDVAAGGLDLSVESIVEANKAVNPNTSGSVEATNRVSLKDETYSNWLLGRENEGPRQFLEAYYLVKGKMTPKFESMFNEKAIAAQKGVNYEDANIALADKYGSDWDGALKELDTDPTVMERLKLEPDQLSRLASSISLKQNRQINAEDRAHKVKYDTEYGIVFEALDESKESATDAIENSKIFTNEEKEVLKNKIHYKTQQVDQDTSNILFRDIDNGAFTSEKQIYERVLSEPVGSAMQYINYWRQTKGYDNKVMPNAVKDAMKFYSAAVKESDGDLSTLEFKSFEYAFRKEVADNDIDPTDAKAVNDTLVGLLEREEYSGWKLWKTYKDEKAFKFREITKGGDTQPEAEVHTVDGTDYPVVTTNMGRKYFVNSEGKKILVPNK